MKVLNLYTIYGWIVNKRPNKSGERIIGVRNNDRGISCDDFTLFSGIDTKMRFTVEPPPGDSAFEQWKDAMKAVARLPLGIPDEFRKKVL